MRCEVQHSLTKGPRVGVAMLDKKTEDKLLIFDPYAVRLHTSIVVYVAWTNYEDTARLCARSRGVWCLINIHQMLLS